MRLLLPRRSCLIAFAGNCARNAIPFERKKFTSIGFAGSFSSIENAIQTNGGKKPSRAEVSGAVRKLKNFKGLTGSITFDNKGDPVKAKYFVLQFEKRSYPGKVVKVIEQQAPQALARKS